MGFGEHHEAATWDRGTMKTSRHHNLLNLLKNPIAKLFDMVVSWLSVYVLSYAKELILEMKSCC